MFPFTLDAAGIPVGVTARFSQTTDRCRGYGTDSSPAFSVTVTSQDAAQEARLAALTAQEEGRVPFPLSAEECEFTALCRKICDGLASYGAVLLHASAVAVDGQAYLFAAPSGTGKSTHARLWQSLLVERCTVINDDKPFLRVQNGTVTVYGSPWNGKYGVGTNHAVPLRAVCFLSQAPQNRIRPCSAEEAFVALVNQAYRPADKEGCAAVLRTLQTVLQTAAFYRLECNTDPQAAEMAYSAVKP